MSNNDFKSIYERACAYPFVNDGMFATSSAVSIETGAVTPIHDAVGILTSPFARQLSGTNILLPGYNLDFSSGLNLTDRIAVIAIGSNSSPDVLIKKFRDANIGGDFFIAQASIENHAVVHGAFLGAAGTVPATLVPHGKSLTNITVSFLTTEQAEKLTGTEPNYDLVKTATRILTRGLANNPVIAPGALAYVSPWRALSTDGVSPLALTAIPSETPLQKMHSEDAATYVTRLLAPDQTAEHFFNSLDLSIEARLIANYKLQSGSITSCIAGQQVKAATISQEAEKRGLPVPQIHYRSY